jgi:hypothetical protein
VRRIRRLLGRGRMEREMDKELCFHFERHGGRQYPRWYDARGGAAAGDARVRRPGADPRSKALVAGQLALSLVLITGAGLFLKTLYRLATTDLGFRPERVMAFELSFPRTRRRPSPWDRSIPEIVPRVYYAAPLAVDAR